MMLNQALRLIRTYHDLSQTELCKELGVSNSYLSEIESGKKQPTMELLTKYSDHFEIPLSSILFFSENIDAPKPTSKLRTSIAKKVINLLEWVENKNEAKAKKVS
ncbi:helix-turn-helix domain-containing protein [Pseudomonas syringae pv. syringae]|uniref:helix-turn-helix transcriptional regulator n=1 Tax=Pseudomonas TaxID=286 RepID=UPI001F0FE170|nr:helix-turn-helix transcriptional regulator [Pseudomonas syringae]MCH5500960.1 helix-turn-helix domain-containing protein [Pseudomonas syringae pv. syringae]MCH5526884.1 helix-turn-helix domain-containing protein [Pseudomonas syringae pv. syringae]MCH5562021.1 helix-turn-helix domain-containing protein [Pseudomonas syringae pv. syringae]MCH5567163.1 helix-turn-helix domain-containing protein [Pseudomonas syringae pv. syringae]MCH5595428.1 helix-turn-helix domain-containing protein [Pseudomon